MGRTTFANVDPHFAIDDADEDVPSKFRSNLTPKRTWKISGFRTVLQDGSIQVLVAFLCVSSAGEAEWESRLDARRLLLFAIIMGGLFLGRGG